ncbi:MAG: Gfo/Idh/MocA family oxidoreductase [Burkholderiaceae bacterium]
MILNRSLSKGKPVRLGVIGLGRGFMLMLAAFDAHPGIQLTAACAPRAQSRDAFVARYPGAFTTDSVAALCARSDVDAVYIATPHQMHRDHILCAAAAGKHLLVDKPLAIDMADADDIVAAVAQAGVHLIVGPSHSFDEPVRHAAALLRGGGLGKPRQIQALNYTDFLYRPRRPEELVTARGGGVVFSQAAHQVDVVRLLAGCAATAVYAHTGNWDRGRSTEGAYTAMIHFGDSCCATLTYSGYAHFDSDEWMDWVGELGHRKSPKDYGRARRLLDGVTSPADEAALKMTRSFGSAPEPDIPEHHEHFGPIVVSTEQADLRLTATGVWIYGNNEKRFEPVAQRASPRAAVLDALFAAVRDKQPALQTAAWGRASLEICHAILGSARTGQPIRLQHQDIG